MMSDCEALCLMEFSSIASGTRAVDALLKQAPVKVERMGTVQPGKLAVLFGGDVESVTSSHQVAREASAGALLDDILLAQVEPSVYHAVLGRVGSYQGDTLGVVESRTMAGALAAADVAVKGAFVSIVSVVMGDEIGGKGLVHLVGEQHDVEAALVLAGERAESQVRALQSSITGRFDESLRALLGRSPRFWGGATR